MEIDDLVRRAPQLFHTTAAETWPGVAARGLLPADRLLEIFEVDAAEREQLLTRRRPTARRLTHPEHGVAWIRDQRPLTEVHLARMLEGSGMSVADYLRRLNGLAFFWADPARLEALRTIPRYARDPQVLLRVDTRSLLTAHAERVVVTRINSGSAIFPSGRRGPDTFRALADFPVTDAPVEVAVAGGVPDLADHLVEEEFPGSPG